MTRTDRTGRLRFWGAALLLGLMVLTGVAGCGRRGTVYGVVTCNSKPVVTGTVSLIASDGLQYQGIIGTDGYFEIFDVPAGPSKVGVVSLDPEARYQKALAVHKDTPQADKIKPPEVDRSQWFGISSSYQNPDNSGLVFEVKRGDNEFNILLDRTAESDGPPPKAEKDKKDKDKKDKDKKDKDKKPPEKGPRG